MFSYLGETIARDAFNAGLSERTWDAGVTRMGTKKELSSFNKAEIQVLDEFGKKNGLAFILVDQLNDYDDKKGETVKLNAAYLKGTNKIVIAMDARQKLLLSAAGHEVFHYLKDSVPADALALQDMVIRALKRNENFDFKARYDDIAELYGTTDEDIILEEMTANSMFDVLLHDYEQIKDEKGFLKIIRKVKKALENFISKIRDIINSSLQPEVQALRDDIQMLEYIQYTFEQMFEKANAAAAAAKAQTVSDEAESTDSSDTAASMTEKNTAVSGVVASRTEENNEENYFNNSLQKYSDELAGYIKNRGDFIIDSREKLVQAVSTAFDEPTSKATVYFGIIGTDTLDRIKNSIPNLPREYRDTLFKEGRDYSIAATFDSIRHISDDKNLTRDDVVNYLNHLADTIVEYDSVSFSYYTDSYGNKLPALLFKKTFEDGTYASFDIVSHGKRSISLHTIYLENADYKKRKFAKVLLMQKSLSHTPEVRTGQTPNIIIRDNSENSNTDLQKNAENSDNSDIKASRAEDFGELFGSRDEFENEAEKVELYKFIDERYEKSSETAASKAEKGTAVSGVKYSVREDFISEFDTWFNSTTREERLKDGNRILIGTTSGILQRVGVKNFNIYFGKSKIQKILDKHHEITADIIKQAVKLLDEPIVLMKSLTVKNSIIAFGEVYTADGNPVMISILLNPQNKTGEVLDYGVVTSAYDRTKSNVQNLLNRSVILYLDKNRTDNWLKALGLQLPSAITSYGSINSISDSSENSNTDLQNDAGNSENSDIKASRAEDFGELFGSRDEFENEAEKVEFYKFIDEQSEKSSDIAAGMTEKNTAVSGVQTSIKFSKMESYPYDMQTVIKQYISSVDEKLKRFVSKYYDNHNTDFDRLNISDVSTKQRKDIRRILNMDCEGYVNAINKNAVIHVDDRHGKHGTQDNSMQHEDDFARIDYILQNYDNVEILTDKNGNPVYSTEFRDNNDNPVIVIKYRKKINGTYYIVQAVPESQYKKLWVVTAYIQKNEPVTQALSADAERSTPEATLASPSSDIIIRDNSENSNTDLQNDAENSENSDIKASRAEDFGELFGSRDEFENEAEKVELYKFLNERYEKSLKLCERGRRILLDDVVETAEESDAAYKRQTSSIRYADDAPAELTDSEKGLMKDADIVSDRPDLRDGGLKEFKSELYGERQTNGLEISDKTAAAIIRHFIKETGSSIDKEMAAERFSAIAKVMASANGDNDVIMAALTKLARDIYSEVLNKDTSLYE